MASHLSLPPDTTLAPITVQRLNTHITHSFSDTISRFRSLVPQVHLASLRSATNAQDTENAIKATGTTTDFVLFYEIAHTPWIKFFPAEHSDSFSKTEHPAKPVGNRKGCHRFIFGNPLIAITMLREDIEAGLHVPVECEFVEQEDGSTKMIMNLPGGLIAGHEAGQKNEGLKKAVGKLEEKILKLIELISQP